MIRYIPPTRPNGDNPSAAFFACTGDELCLQSARVTPSCTTGRRYVTPPLRNLVRAMAGVSTPVPDIWDSFERTRLLYRGRTYFASCNHCFGPLSSETLEEIKNAKDKDDAARDAVGKAHHLLLGNPKPLWRHLQTCTGAPPVLRGIAHGEVQKYNAARRERNARKRCGGIAVDGQPASRRRYSAPSISLPALPAQMPAVGVAYPIGDGGQFYDTEKHGNLVAEALSLHNVPASFFASPQFHALQTFYCGSADKVKSADLYLTPEKLQKFSMLSPQAAIGSDLLGATGMDVHSESPMDIVMRKFKEHEEPSTLSEANALELKLLTNGAFTGDNATRQLLLGKFDELIRIAASLGRDLEAKSLLKELKLLTEGAMQCG